MGTWIPEHVNISEADGDGISTMATVAARNALVHGRGNEALASPPVVNNSWSALLVVHVRSEHTEDTMEKLDASERDGDGEAAAKLSQFMSMLCSRYDHDKTTQRVVW